MNMKLLCKEPFSLEQRVMHFMRYQLLYTYFFFFFWAALQFLCGYVERDKNSIISFVEKCLKLVLYLFVVVLCNSAFGTSVVSSVGL